MDGMQHFDGEIERLIRAGVLTKSVGLSYATNPNNLALELSDVPEDVRAPAARVPVGAAAGAASGGSAASAAPVETLPDWLEE